ncbi:MAG TPA: hypothetical protein VGV37_13830 [Aliidongia sp.]|uniref:hypothetical protein n=1 Tax=Aliidongia sp. TaxID=1914230 RepID=UPI002DDD9DBF|nr:hypothetical protein [Aliidongia sp.]HEV2675619.1 hypothetical protein [Aliidongia sp.]
MRWTTGILALWLAASGAAYAQTRITPQPDPNSAPPDKFGAPIDPHPKSTDGSAAPLSEELSRSQGVVHPTGSVDPGMSQTPPDPGPRSMPVIKPPAKDDGIAPK